VNEPVSTTLIVPGDQSMVALLGSGDELLRVIERSVVSDVHVRGNEITITGKASDNAVAVRLFEELLDLIRGGTVLSQDAVSRTMGILTSDSGERPAEVLSLNILSRRGKNIRPKTLNQKRYVDAIDHHTVVFGIGPAGTGKTYLAVAKAVQALQAKQVNRIILTRPAVEAGERLGFLPGTLFDKIDPYLRPLLDALHDMVDPESIPRLMQAGTIEIAPLAYMRGRAQPYSTQVATPQGFRSLGSLEVGDLVIGSDGTPTPVLGIYPQGEKEVFRVRTQDGGSTLCCGEHLWSVRTVDDRSHGRPSRVLETREMIGNLKRGRIRRYELPLVRPIEFEPRETPMDAYALGLLLGDGCLTTQTTPSFTPVGTTPPGGTLTAHPGTDVRHDVRLGVHPTLTTSVPAEYLFNSAAVRIAVLQGLLDDAGHLTQSGRIQYTTTAAHLRDDVVWLVRSLGGTAYRPVSPAVEHRHDAHMVEIRLPASIEPFRLGRKRDVYRKSGGGTPMRFIDSIESAGVHDTMCIQVAAADSLYVTDDFLVTHNTLNDAFIILDEAQNTTLEQMKMFLTRLGFGSRVVVTGDVTQVDLPGGTQSGLRVVRDILGDIDDVHFEQLTSADVVRHRLVAEIVDAYTRWDERTAQSGPQSAHPQSTRQQGPRSARGQRS
jgi:phosphate starvation-inducible PhoH-like protein